MNTIILSCGNLLDHVAAAQSKMSTNYEVVELDTRLHEFPEKMRSTIDDALKSLDDSVDTVLMAIGLCGGSVSDFPLPKRLVIPKVDDCITMLLHTDETWHPNLKLGGHLYLTDKIDDVMSTENILKDLTEKYGVRGQQLFDRWFQDYHHVDIIDTGAYDCFSQSYMDCAKRNAQLIDCPLAHVPGSNILLEKLVSGRWDHQFLIGEKGQTLYKEDYIEE